MNWKPQLPEILLGISLAMIAVEASLGHRAAIKARYRARDTYASLGMQAGNIAMNLMMAGVVFAGLSVAYQHRLSTISPSSAWSWLAIFFLDDFIYYWFHRISHECRFWWAGHVNHHSSQEYNLSTAALRDRQEHCDFQPDTNCLSRMARHVARRGRRPLATRGGRRHVRSSRVACRWPRTHIEEHSQRSRGASWRVSAN